MKPGPVVMFTDPYRFAGSDLGVELIGLQAQADVDLIASTSMYRWSWGERSRLPWLHRSRRKGPRTIGLGLDGASFTLVEEMIKKGELPNLTDLATTGSALRMDSSLPPVSTVAWASLFTGKDPGGFGVFGFEERVESSYGTYIPNRKDLRADTLYTIMERSEMAYVSVNVPMTHPPFASGRSVMISSLLSPGLREASSSPKVFTALRKMGYRLDLTPSEMKDSPDELMVKIREIYASREKAMFHFLRRGCDLFLGVFTESDRLSHLTYDGKAEEEGPIREIYRLFDDTVGHLLSEIQPGTRLLVLSDHGFCPAESQLHLDRWLIEEGYLHVDENAQQRSLSSIKGNSQAYALDSGRVYVNLRMREPLGCVETGEEYDSLVDDLAADLGRLKRPLGGRCAKRVWRKDEAYSGPYLNRAPDLVVETEKGVEVKTGWNATEVFGKPRAAGMHLGSDAMLISSDPLEVDEVRIQDCFSFLMSPLGLGPHKGQIG